MKSTLPWLSIDALKKVKGTDSDYEDTGCGGLCTKSTECPFPVCIYEAYPYKEPLHKKNRIKSHRIGRPPTGRFITCIICGRKRWCRPYVIKTYAAKYCGKRCMAEDPGWRVKVGFTRGRKKVLTEV